MSSSCLQTWLFCTLIFLVEACIAWFLGHFYYKAAQKTKESDQWRWSSEDSRDTWIDAAKTMISASGIAAALLATLAARQTPILNPLVASSVKAATAILVVCVCASMFLILALARGHEAAKARYMTKLRAEGHQGEIKEGPLSYFALRVMLVSAFVALSGFFVGFLFLVRIVWHL
jgi:uncharacterized protein (DUF2062 family)